MFAAQAIMLDQADVVVAGGMESMSNIPYYLPNARWGYKYGNAEFVDGLAKDGLTDAYNHKAMGVSADNTAAKYNISREDQDAFAIESYKRAAAATEAGRFKGEIVPVPVPQRKGDPVMVAEDEEYKRVKFEKIPSLRPAFSKDGTVTAANASTINDGASALVVVSEEAIQKEYETAIAAMKGKEYKASHILVDSEDKAKEVIAELKKGGNFAELAKEKSSDSSAANGGDLGWFTPSMMVPPFAQAVAKMEKGKFSEEPVQTPFGWHVILLEDSRAATPPSLTELKPQIQQMLQSKMVNDYLEKLRSGAKIEVKEIQVSEAKPATAKPAAPEADPKAKEEAKEEAKQEAKEEKK